jgi:hypothetical protein
VNNAGFYGENSTYDTSASYLNFQIWLYETSNDIEFRFGAMNIQNPSDNLYNGNGFMSGLIDSLDWNTAASNQANMLNGVFSNPVMVGPNSNLSDVITGNIDNGRVYKFTRAIPTSIAKHNLNSSISIYPNPAREQIFITNLAEKATANVYDISGKLVLLEITAGTLNISSLEKGIYTVKLVDNNGATILASKLIISE